MNRKKLLNWIPIALFMLTVLTTPALAGMGGNHDGGGMGESRNEHRNRGIARDDHETDSNRNRQSNTGMRNDHTRYTFESMRRLSAGSMTDGGVRMELKPYLFENGVFRMKFYANTRSVNLGNYEMMELMHLEYRNMKYKPISMDRMHGQNAEGEVEFHIPEAPDRFRIVIRGLPNMEEHVFQW